MKLFKIEYDVAKPSAKRISVPTDTEAYAVGIKVLENGKDMHLAEDEVTMMYGGEVLSANGTFNGYIVFNFSSNNTETDKVAKVKVNAKAHYVDALVDKTSPGPTSTIMWMNNEVPNISSLAGTTMTEPTQCYGAFYIYDTDDNLVSTYIKPSEMTQSFGPADETGYLIALNPKHEPRYVRQLGINIDYGIWKKQNGYDTEVEKLDYFTFPDAEQLTSILAIRGNITGVPADYKVKFRQYYSGKDVNADLDLYIDECNSSIGEIADQPKFTKSIELNGVYSDDTTFSYTIPAFGE